jgi:hypothetical protein
MGGEVVGSLVSGKGGRVEGSSTGIELTGPNSGKGGSPSGSGTPPVGSKGGNPSGLGSGSPIGGKGGRGGDWALTGKKTCTHIEKTNKYNIVRTSGSISAVKGFNCGQKLIDSKEEQPSLEIDESNLTENSFQVLRSTSKKGNSAM